MIRKFMVAALVAGVLPQPAAAAATVGANALDEWNLIVLGDLNSNSNVEGRTFVGGSVTGPNSADFNTRGTVSTRGQSGLTVVGNVEGNSKNIRGGADVGGNVASSFNMNGTNDTVTVGGTIPPKTFGNGNKVVAGVANPASANYDATFLPDLQNLGAALSASMLSLSDYLMSLPATIATAGFRKQNNQGAFTASGSLNVINLNGGLLSGLDQITFANSGTTIVNVAGTNLTLGSNFNGPQNLGENVIWNFYEAGTLNFTRSFYGSVLAPRANATISNFIDGTAVFGNLQQNGEIHLGTFHGNVPVPPSVPEPSTWLMLIAGFGMIGAGMRRRGAVRLQAA